MIISHAAKTNLINAFKVKNEHVFDNNNLELIYSDLQEGMKYLKILTFRRNEHFGDVLMFLNQPSPVVLKVKTKFADLFLLKKIDFANLAKEFPDIIKKAYETSVHNFDVIQLLIERAKIQNAKIIENEPKRPSRKSIFFNKIILSSQKSEVSKDLNISSMQEMLPENKNLFKLINTKMSNINQNIVRKENPQTINDISESFLESKNETSFSEFTESDNIENDINNQINEFLVKKYNYYDELGLKIYGNDVLNTNSLLNNNRKVCSSNWFLDTSVSSADSFTIDNLYETVKEGEFYFKTTEFCKECEHCNTIKNETNVNKLMNVSEDILLRPTINKRTLIRRQSVKMIFGKDMISESNYNINEKMASSDSDSIHSGICNADKAEVKVRQMNLRSQLQKNIENSNMNILDPSSFYKKWMFDIHSKKINKMDRIAYQTECMSIHNRLDFLFMLIGSNLPNNKK
jgi:hypothetical protein